MPFTRSLPFPLATALLAYLRPGAAGVDLYLGPGVPPRPCWRAELEETVGAYGNLARVAQTAEHLIRNQVVGGSIPPASSR